MTLRPIFIGGCDRSGTTLLGSMLGAHSRCICVPESQFIIEVLGDWVLRQEQFDPQLVRAHLARHDRFNVWELDLEQSSGFDKETFASYSELIEWIVRQYAHKHGKHDPRWWIDHTPSNVKYATTLLSLFPQAKVLHLIRDGRAVVSSLLALRWGPAAIDSAAYFWLRNLAYGLAVESFFGAGHVMRLKYEDLITKPEVTLQGVCSFLDFDYEPEMTRGNGFAVPAFTQKDHALVGKGLDHTRINAWEKALTARQIEIFESITGDMLACLGYTPVFGASARKMSNMERIVGRLKTPKMYIGNQYQRIRRLAVRSLPHR